MSMVQVVSFDITTVAPPFDRIDAHASLLAAYVALLSQHSSEPATKKASVKVCLLGRVVLGLLLFIYLFIYSFLKSGGSFFSKIVRVFVESG